MRRPTVATSARLSGAVLLLASGLVPWTATGTGSSLSLAAAIAVLLRLRGTEALWLATAPTAGAALIVVRPSPRPTWRWARAALLVVAATGFVVALVSFHAAHPADWGPGAWVAAIGLAIAIGGEGSSMIAAARRGRGPVPRVPRGS